MTWRFPLADISILPFLLKNPDLPLGMPAFTIQVFGTFIAVIVDAICRSVSLLALISQMSSTTCCSCLNTVVFPFKRRCPKRVR